MTNRQERFSQRIWTTKDGQQIPFAELSDSHLSSILAKFERAHRDFILSTEPPCFSGEMAQWSADTEYNQLISSTPEDLFPVYGPPWQERENRRQKSRG